ncbi:MAG: RagB/SusD family nutrient uptake outer membrane protein, partial [Prevotella sp.]|nr:RagB/SusD family nutrient uptake outer membrane protein [Prevotella sp.]
MKLKSIIAPSLILGSLMFAVTSCGDFFDQDSEQVIYADKGHLGNATDTIYSVTGILDKLQNLSDRTILLGELRGDLMDINSTTSSDLRDIALFQIGDSNVYNSPRDYYAVINNCNYFIAKVDTALKNNRNEYIFMREYAAVKAFRAWTYLQLVINYGRVPFVTEPILSKEEADRDHATKDIREVCDYLIADIAPYADIETPNYGEIRNTDSKLFYFPIYILLGDLNLWAGHYKEAAVAYYKYLSTRNGAESAYPTSINCSRWYN